LKGIFIKIKTNIMKKVRIGAAGLIVFMGFGPMGCAQNTVAPKLVSEAFTQKFPSAQKLKWDKESDTEWEAEFKLNGVEYSANFLEDGTWKETEHEIKLKEVPENIRGSLKANFADYKVEEVEVSETEEGTLYEFELEKGIEEWEVALDLNGTVVKKESIKEDGEQHRD
jgi:hypothetical protein